VDKQTKMGSKLGMSQGSDTDTVKEFGRLLVGLNGAVDVYSLSSG
jgi:hypothetical protein